MHVSPISKGYKTGALAVGISLVLVLLGLSVSEGMPQASGKTDDTVHAVARGVTPKARKTVKKAATKKTTFKPTLIAGVTAPAKTSTLLAVANQPSFTQDHKTLADKVLRTLPEHCRTHLKNFYIIYQDAKQRGLGGKSTIIVDGSVPDEEFIGLLTHECAHVTHSNLMGNVTAGASAFKDGNDIFYKDSPMAQFFSISWMAESILKADASSTDFVSGYAKSDAFEDFAETFAMYVLHRDAFETRAQSNAAIKAKLTWMQTYLPMPENTLGTSTYAAESKVPWDVTRLPFVLR